MSFNPFSRHTSDGNWGKAMAHSEVERARKRWEAADRRVIQIRSALPAQPTAVALARLKAAEDLRKAAKDDWLAMIDLYGVPSDRMDWDNPKMVAEGTPGKWTLTAEHPDRRTPILESYATESGARERAAHLVGSGYTVETVLAELSRTPK
jgi:hypothetical protein